MDKDAQLHPFRVFIKMRGPGGTFVTMTIPLSLPLGLSMEEADRRVREAVFANGGVSYEVTPAAPLPPDSKVKVTSEMILPVTDVEFALDLQKVADKKPDAFQKVTVHVWPGEEYYLAAELHAGEMTVQGQTITMYHWGFCKVTPAQLRAIADAMERRQATTTPIP